MPFDYENAERDILDAGGDPDYLSYNDPVARNNYLRQLGLRPEDYTSGRQTSNATRSTTHSDAASSDGGIGCALILAPFLMPVILLVSFVLGFIYVFDALFSFAMEYPIPALVLFSCGGIIVYRSIKKSNK